MQESRWITPKFVTEKLVQQAVRTVLNAVFGQNSPIKHLPKRHACHVTALIASMEDARRTDYPAWPNYPLRPHCIYEESIDREKWTGPYDNIAKCKALQHWGGRTEGTAAHPWLLFAGDTVYFGSAGIPGLLVVSCSGIQPHFDHMIATMIFAAIKALAIEAWKRSSDCEKEVDFLTSPDLEA